MTTVLAIPAEFVTMAPRMFGSAFLSSRVAGGRGYLLVEGTVDEPLTFTDIDNELLLEAFTFATMDAATAWIDADIAQRQRPA